MALLGIPFRIVEVNTYDGSTRKPDFLEKNPIGKVPLIEFEDGRRLAEFERHAAASRRRHALSAGRSLRPRQGL